MGDSFVPPGAGRCDMIGTIEGIPERDEDFAFYGVRAIANAPAADGVLGKRVVGELLGKIAQGMAVKIQPPCLAGGVTGQRVNRNHVNLIARLQDGGVIFLPRDRHAECLLALNGTVGQDREAQCRGRISRCEGQGFLANRQRGSQGQYQGAKSSRSHSHPLPNHSGMAARLVSHDESPQGPV